MNLKCFPLMSTTCKGCMQRRNWKFGKNGGKIYHYTPQQRLVDRLAYQLQWTEQQVREQIFYERLYLLRQLYGESVISEKDV